MGHIATTTDSWTADNTKGSFLGVTAHWIEIKDDTWKMRSSVIGFKALSGSHSGDNLGRQFVGILKRAGIVTPNGHKVRSLFFLNHRRLFFFSAQHYHGRQCECKRRALPNSRTPSQQDTGGKRVVSRSKSTRVSVLSLVLFVLSDLISDV